MAREGVARLRAGAHAFSWLGMALLLGATAVPTAVDAQIAVSGYALGMGSRSGSAAFTEGGSTLLGRARVMIESTGDAVSLDAAYEHVLTRAPDGRLGLATPGVGGTGDWLGTDWQLWSTSESEWRHRLDRLSVAFSRGPLEVTIGRQAISWATALFLTPADPFVPFDPSDPFRVYRSGVDAARIRVFPGPFTEVEAVVRATETALGTTTTALARVQTSVGGWALGGWTGALHDEPAAAVFGTGALGATAVRTEVALREDPAGGAAARAVIGLDRFFTPGGKDLYVVGEVQFDGYGARSASDLLNVALSEPFGRGDMQTLGRWTFASQVSYQVHPLVGLDALVMLNADDGSALLAPGLSWSATESASVRVGAYSGLGRDADPPVDVTTGPLALASEYGSIPAIGYVSLTWFF